MTRQKLPASSLQSSIKGHLVPDVAQGYETVCQFLEEYEMPAGVVNNLMAAKKHLQKALALTKAAEVIIDFEVTDD